MDILNEKFSKLGVDNAPGQEVRQWYKAVKIHKYRIIINKYEKM